MEVTVVYCFFVVCFIHFPSRRKVINHNFPRRTWDSHSWGRNIRQFWRQEKCCPTPGGWDKPIPEVIHLWRHRTSTPNNLEKSRLGCVLNIFCTFLGKNEKDNQTPHWGRDSGIPSSCLRFATSTTRQASSWIANLRHSEGIPSSLPQSGVRFY